VDQYLIKHELIKRLHRRFNQEGIVVPFPIRTIEYRDATSIAEVPLKAGPLASTTKSEA
jgi:hypothetical protein